MQFGNKFIDLSKPQVMGILNVTPDSFSDGGKHADVNQAAEHALQMVDEGATFIDIGGESTRPGAPEVSLQEELDRTIPVIEAVAKNASCVISIDSRKYIVCLLPSSLKSSCNLISFLCIFPNIPIIKSLTLAKFNALPRARLRI